MLRETGSIIKEEIRTRYYETKKYPATTEFFSNANTDVPDGLSIFFGGRNYSWQEKKFHRWVEKKGCCHCTLNYSCCTSKKFSFYSFVRCWMFLEAKVRITPSHRLSVSQRHILRYNYWTCLAFLVNSQKSLRVDSRSGLWTTQITTSVPWAVTGHST